MARRGQAPNLITRIQRRRHLRLVREADLPALPNDGNDKSTAHGSRANAPERRATNESEGHKHLA
jgi:hypothetical protein